MYCFSPCLNGTHCSSHSGWCLWFTIYPNKDKWKSEIIEIRFIFFIILLLYYYTILLLYSITCITFSSFIEVLGDHNRNKQESVDVSLLHLDLFQSDFSLLLFCCLGSFQDAATSSPSLSFSSSPWKVSSSKPTLGGRSQLSRWGKIKQSQTRQ